MDNKINIKNKKASFEYFFIEVFTAGIVITGSEIKSIREGKAQIGDAFCVFEGNELYVRNMHIAEFFFATYNNHAPKRDRKLLLNRKELNKLFVKSKEKGLTIIPIRLFLTDKGLAKIDIALAKGKKLYDKREDIKQKDIRRDMERVE